MKALKISFCGFMGIVAAGALMIAINHSFGSIGIPAAFLVGNLCGVAGVVLGFKWAYA